MEDGKKEEGVMNGQFLSVFGHLSPFLMDKGLSVTILDVIGVIEDEEKFGNLDNDDSICLCLILALEVIFIGRLLTCPVDDTLFRLVENLEDWNCFPWDYLVEDELRLRLEDKESMRLEQEKNIIEEQRFSVTPPNWVAAE
ncbi:hypothetical protein Tco_1120262 [Tanacetum coccineum]